MSTKKNKLEVLQYSSSSHWSFILSFRKKTESPFESKPKLARTNSLDRKPHDLTVDTNKNEIGKSSVIRIDYNPSSGVTFRENRTSDVQVVGKGYNDEPNETKPIIMGANGRRRRVQPKGTFDFNCLLYFSQFFVMIWPKLHKAL